MEISVPFLCEIAGVTSWWLLLATLNHVSPFTQISLKFWKCQTMLKAFQKLTLVTQRAERNLDKPHSMEIIDKKAPVVGLCAQLNMEICRAFDFRILVESLRAFACLWRDLVGTPIMSHILHKLLLTFPLSPCPQSSHRIKRRKKSGPLPSHSLRTANKSRKTFSDREFRLIRSR